MYLHIQVTKRSPDWRKTAMCNQLFFKTNLFKEWIKKFVTLITNEKGKTAMNERENNDSEILWALFGVYKKFRTSFLYLLVNLFKQR